MARSRAAALDNPHAQLKWNKPADEVLAEPMLVDPLRKDDCPPISDGVAAVVLAADDVARAQLRPPGVDPRHRPPHRVRGARPARPHRLTVDARRGRARPVSATAPVDVAELHAPFSHQELILRDALGLGDGVDINPSGGALCANPMHGRGAHPHRRGRATGRSTGAPTVASPTRRRGPCLQQNLVCVLEGEG